MSKCIALAGIAGALFIGAALPVMATSNYEYKKGEYVIVEDGLSPDKLYSLATHGEGEFGYDNFHVYLMAEPAHRKIVTLNAIEHNLDAGANAFRAAWSPDSRYVALHYRTDRHVLTMLLFEIRGNRAFFLKSPNLIDSAAKSGGKSADDNHLLSSTQVLTWKSPTSFMLEERRRYRPSDPGLLQALGPYGHPPSPAERDNKDAANDVMFSAEAMCEVTPGRGCRLISIKPGAFD